MVKAEYTTEGSGGTLRVTVPFTQVIDLAKSEGERGILDGVPVTGDALPSTMGTAYTPLPRSNWSSVAPMESRWDLGASWEDTVAMLASGWTDAPSLGRLDAYVQTLTGAAAPEVAMALDYTGGVLDTGLYLQGRPDCLWGFIPTEVKPRISLGYELSASCGVDAKTMALRGAVVAVLANWLQGVAMLDISAAAVTKSGPFKVELVLEVGRPGEPLDRNAIAFFAAHPVTLRRVCFRLWELFPDAWRRAMGFNGGNYGYPDQVREDRRPDVYFGRQLPKDLADAMATLKNSVATIKRDLLGLAD